MTKIEEHTVDTFKEVVASVLNIELSNSAAELILTYAHRIRESKGHFTVPDAAFIAVKSYIEKINVLVEVSSTASVLIPLTDLDLSKRALNTLHSLNIFTVEDLRSLKLESLRKMYNCGKRTMVEIEYLMEKYDIWYVDF